MTNKQTAVFNSKLFGRSNHEQGCIHSHNLKGKISLSENASLHSLGKSFYVYTAATAGKIT